MIIIVDVDGTVGDFTGALLAEIGETDRSIATKWDWFSLDPRLSTQQKEAARKALVDADFWKSLPLIEDATKGIQWLRGQGHKIVWVTTPFTPCFGWESARRDWLIRNFRIDKHDEPLIFAKDKYLVQADVIIDDTPEVLDKYGAYNPDSICITLRSEMNELTNRNKVTWDDIMSMPEFYYK